MSVVTIMEMMMNKNVVFFHTKSTVGFNKKKRNDNLMTKNNEIYYYKCVCNNIVQKKDKRCSNCQVILDWT